MTSDDAMTRWREWQGTPWGRLRYTQAEANLSHHLPPPPAKVLDLAGGDGADAVRLARRGHSVTVVDQSADMLAGAERTFADEGLPVELVRADLADDLPGGFDVVLLHNVIQYLDDPADAVRRAVSRAAPGGLVSVIAINRHSEPLRQALLDLDPAGALAAVGADRARTRTFDTTLTLYTADEVAGWLDECEIVGHHGICAVTGYIADNARKHDPVFYADLERLELTLADRMPYPLTARFFHLVARR